MKRRLFFATVISAVLLAPRFVGAQGQPGARPDSIVVRGLHRLDPAQALEASGLAAGRTLGYRDIQRAIQALYGTGQYADVRVLEDTIGSRQVLILQLREQPLLLKWAIRGVTRLSEGSVREKVQLAEGRPVNPAAVVHAEARIDSLYRVRGYYLARVHTLRVYDADSSHVRIIFDVDEGRRVAIAQTDIQGNTRFPDATLVKQMKTKPEGFWWFRSGDYDDDKLREDLLVRLPAFYGERGYADFQVLKDTLLVNDSTGKATLVVQVSEGQPYRVGTFEIVGNRRFSTDELEQLYPFGGKGGGAGAAHAPAQYFNVEKWNDATQALRMLYYNNGYLYMNARAEVVRRTDPDGAPAVDLRWVLTEAQPAVVNKVEIVGNDVTHERVIRDAIVVLPGDVFRQDALIRSYQNISNLGFFDQPLPLPDTRPVNDQGDVDVIFRVTEKHTGSVNFGASLGQGTGVGGFIGLEEPNLLGTGKRGRLQWQFGQNINDFDLSYTDPALRQSRISGTLGLHDYRVRYQIANLGTLKTRGASLEFGIPAFGDRYTRLFLSYAADVQTFTGTSTSAPLAALYSCNDCLRSTISGSVMRDTRIDMPFPTGGTMHQVGIAQSGGVLGGTGDFQRVDLEGHWYAPLGDIGPRGKGQLKFVLALAARSGFVFGSAPFINQLFTMGGTQFGIRLRGYDEFSITPTGYDPNASSGVASAGAFGKAFFSITGDAGVRISQMLYLDVFSDAGNVWARASEFDPTRLFRSVGVGVSMISPLGPIGVDGAYGFDRKDVLGRPAPGWKIHFRLGNALFQ